MRPRSPALGAGTYILLGFAALAAGCSSGGSQDTMSTASLPPRPETGMMREQSPYYTETGTLGYAPPSGPSRSAPPYIQTGSIGHGTPPPAGAAQWHASQHAPYESSIPPSAVPRDSQLIEVREGDTLFSLARRHGVSVTELAQVNRLSSARLDVGQRIYVPAR